jgi:hypothetical protein
MLGWSYVSTLTNVQAACGYETKYPYCMHIHLFKTVMHYIHISEIEQGGVVINLKRCLQQNVPYFHRPETAFRQLCDKKASEYQMGTSGVAVK